METRQVLALNALVQLAERITAMTPEDRRQAAIRNNAEVAEIYDQIEQRILLQALRACRSVMERRFGVPRQRVEELFPIDEKNPTLWRRKDQPPLHIVFVPVEEEYADRVMLKGSDWRPQG